MNILIEMTPTPFYELAEKIGNDIDGKWYCCMGIKHQYSDFFLKWFRPTTEEHTKYNLSLIFWMGSRNNTWPENNADRIIAMLLADQIWKDENK